MARQDIAAEWLKENNTQTRREGRRAWSIKDKAFRAWKARGVDYDWVAYHPLDVASQKRLREDECRKAYFADPLRFVRDRLSFDGEDCLLLPFARRHSAARVVLDGKPMSAYRAMCLLAHGQPPDPKDVARHLCGCGHLNCVNPRHLAWGSTYQNMQDKALHFDRPVRMPSIPQDVMDTIRESKDTVLPRVLAVRLGIHASVIEALQR